MFENYVKWFSDEKGFGFIEHEDGNDLFVHYSSIRMKGHKLLQEGQRVSYEIGTSLKNNKPMAINVIILSPKENV